MRKGELAVIVVLLLVLGPIAQGWHPGSDATIGHGASPTPENETSGPDPDTMDLLSDVEGTFTENLGQGGVGPGKYYCLGSPLSVSFATSQVFYDYRPSGEGRGFAFSVRFEGARQVEPVGVGSLDQRTNFLAGSDKDEWTTGVRSFGSIEYPSLYEGIDLRFYTEGPMLKYEFVLDPFVDPSVIEMEYTDVDGVSLDGDGDLIVRTPVGCMFDERPVSYFTVDRNTIDSTFELRKGHSVGFDVGLYNRSRSITIDPGLECISYLGGAGREDPRGMATDVSDNIYMVGVTPSPDFPTTPGAYNTTVPTARTAFMAKLSPDCSQLLVSTFIPGCDVQAILIAENGSIVIYGVADSQDYPISPGGGSASEMDGPFSVVTVLSSDGSSILYSRIICDGMDSGRLGNILVGQDGDVYLSGCMDDDSLPEVDGFDTTYGGQSDGFVLRLSSDLTRIINGTYIGGSGHEGNDPEFYWWDSIWLDLDRDGCVYVTGTTDSADLPTTRPTLQATKDGYKDAFLMKMDSNLTTLHYSTYLGGSGEDSHGKPIALDNGRVLVYGRTDSDDYYTTASAYQSSRCDSWDLYLSVIDTKNNKLEYSTYFGGNLTDNNPWMYHRGNSVVCMMYTGSTDLPTTLGCYQDTGGWKATLFVFKLDIDKSVLLYGSYLGSPSGKEHTQLMSPSQDPNELIFVATTNSDEFPAQDGYQQNFSGNRDLIVGRFNLTDRELFPPTIPENTTAEIVQGGVLIRWSPPSNDGGLELREYDITRFNNIDNLTETIQEVSTLYLDTNVTPGASYGYRVRANTRYSPGNWSDWVNITYYTKPTANFTLEADQGNNSVVLSWDGPKYPDDTGGMPILGYRLYRGTDQFSTPLLVELGDVNTYLDSNVTNGETYYYRISVVTAIGEGPMTKWVKARPHTVPNVPADFRAVGYDGHVLLYWYPSSDTGGARIEGYRIYRGPSPDNYAFRTTIIGDVRTFNDTGLTNGQTYYYRILAFNEAGDGVLSRAINVTPIGLPSAPVEPRAIVGNGTVQLHWGRPAEDGGDNEFVYLVWREPLFEGELDVMPSLETFFVDYNVTNGITYRYRIQATNAAGFGPRSDVIYATPLTLPDPPGSFVLAPGERSIELSWDFPIETGGSPVVEFIVYRGETPEYLEPYVTIDADIPHYIDEDVIEGQTYYYMVAAVTEAGEGLATPVMSARAIGPPTRPLDLKAAAGDSEVTLTWSEPERDGGRALWGYVVLRSEVDDGMTEIARLGVTLSFTDVGLENGRTYHYQVAAYNSINDGPGSNIVDAIPLGVPDLVRNVHTSIEETTVTLLWEAPDDDGGRPVLGYVVFRGPSPTDMEEIAQVGMIQSYTDEGLQRGETYHYQVAARNVVGRGELSEHVQAVIERVEEPVQDDSNWLLFVMMICVCIITVGAIASTESGRYRWGLLLGPLTTRLKREEVLDNKTRHALLGIIITNPGIHYKAIMREFDLKNGVAAYHLDVLERDNFIRSVRDGRLKRFYSTDTKVPHDRRATPEELRQEILELVVANPGISKKEVVNELGVESDTVGYHLRAMVADGTIKDERLGKHMTYYRDAK